MRKIYYLLFPVFIFFGCTTDGINNASTQAYVPVYISSAAANLVSVEAGRSITKAGKIYVFGTWLFENDINKGIHIIDISDRANPKKVAFINVPLSTEVAVKGNFLYTNNYDDLLTFDITNPAVPVLVKRIEDVFPLANQSYPPFTNVRFECADPSKGLVVNWELKQISTTKCRR